MSLPTGIRQSCKFLIGAQIALVPSTHCTKHVLQTNFSKNALIHIFGKVEFRYENPAKYYLFVW